MFEGLKEFITQNGFSLVGFAVAVLFLISGVIFTAIAASLRISERGNFRCDVPDSLENKNTLPFQCFDDYEQQFNSPLPLYGFILLSFLFPVIVCIIYSWCCVKTQVERIKADCKYNEEHPENPRQIITTRRIFRSYLLQLLVRLMMGITFALLQKLVLYPSDFPTGFLCDSSPKPEANATDFNATTSTLINASRINCYNSVGSEKTGLALALWIVNIVFTAILLGEMIYLAVRAWKRKEFMSNIEFCQEYFFNKDKSLLPKFFNRMKERILANRDIIEIEPLIARNPDREQPENRMLDDMYVNLIIHTGRAAHDFESSMEKHEILSYEYVKYEHGSVAINKPKDLFLSDFLLAQAQFHEHRVNMEPSPKSSRPNFSGAPFARVSREKQRASSLNEDHRDPRKILIIGRPGIGKSLLCNKIMRDWANDKEFPCVNKTFEMAFLFKFRWFNFETTEKQCLKELLSGATRSDGKIDKECFQYALDNPDKVLLVFDGLDEFKYRESCLADEKVEPKSGPTDVMRTSALYVKLVQGKLLPGATVVTTCRPNVVGSLAGLKYDRIVEIMGFTGEKVHEYVEKFCGKDDSDTVNRISEHIESNLNLLSLCYIPATCYIVCNILQRVIQLQRRDQQGSGTIVLPTTFTQVYQLFLTMFVRKYHPEYRDKELTMKDLSLKVRFADPVEETLNKLGSLALQGTNQSRLIFKEEEVQGMENCGLLYRMQETETQLYAVEEHFCFIHLTLQEFLAARNIVTDKPSHFISSHAEDPKWHLVIQFVAGLLRGQQNNEGGNSIVNLLRVSLSSNRDKKMALLMMHCLHELNDDTAANRAATQLQASDTFDNTVELTDCHITAVDCTALVYFLKHLELLQELNVKFNPSLGDGGCKEIAKLVREGGPKQLSLDSCKITNQGVSDLCKALKHKCCKLTKLNLARNTITDKGVSDLCEALKHQHCKLTLLNLADNTITDKGVSDLCEALKHLTHLNLARNTITDKGVSDLCEALKHQHCKLAHLNLADNTITDKGVSDLCEVLKHQHCKLTHLTLANNTITDKGASHLCEAAGHENFKLSQLTLYFSKLSSQGKQKLQYAFANTGCHLSFD